MRLLALLVSCAAVTEALQMSQPLHARALKGHLEQGRYPLRPVMELDGQTKARIEEMVGDNAIMLFMKGNKLFPQCGFSNTAVQILNSLSVPYETCDVLADQKVREGIKE